MNNLENVTVRDIAEKVGVSPSTVSLALNNKPNVSPEMRKQILRIAKELGYRKGGRKALASKQKTFVMLFPSWFEQSKNQTYKEYFAGVRTAAEELDVRVSFLPDCFEQMGDVFLDLLSQELEYSCGLLYSGMIRNSKVFKFVLERDMPFVLFNRRYQGRRVGTVGVDYKGNSVKLINYLISKGYKDIIFTATEPHEFSYTEDRYAGYCQALEENGLSLSSDEVIYAKGDEQISRLVDLVKKKKRKGIAIYCDGDTRAHRVILGLQQNGVRVPEDVVVAGFDALEYEDCVPFPSIKFSGYRIGYFATCLLDMMVDHEDLVSYSIVIDGELVRVEHVPEVVR